MKRKYDPELIQEDLRKLIQQTLREAGTAIRASYIMPVYSRSSLFHDFPILASLELNSYL